MRGFELTNLPLGLERDVAAEHVVQQDAEGPHGGRVTAVPPQPDPLWRRVHASACSSVEAQNNADSGEVLTPELEKGPTEDS